MNKAIESILDGNATDKGNGYNILNTEKLLSNKNSRQKRNKPDTKCIKVLTKNYNEAIQLLKDKGLLYET